MKYPPVRRSKSIQNSNTILIIILATAVIVYLIARSKGIQYNNTEIREIERNEQGFITKITIHRDARQT